MTTAYQPVVEHRDTLGDYWQHQRLYRFDNGYGASVIQAPFTHGHLELAVMKWTGEGENDREMVPVEPLTDDIGLIGGLGEEDLPGVFAQIERL